MKNIIEKIISGTVKRYFLLIISLVLLIIGQVVGKYASYYIDVSSFRFFMFFHPLVILGYSLILLRGVTWILVLRKFTLSFAYPFMSLAYIFVFIFSYILFGEQFTLLKLFSIFIIIFGVSFITLGTKSGGVETC
jgi:drug/metabolite transporter (DMT)-like permease